jgi:hypothetical protein
MTRILSSLFEVEGELRSLEIAKIDTEEAEIEA